MNFSDYVAQSAETAVYPEGQGIGYAGLGLVDEIGEVVEKLDLLDAQTSTMPFRLLLEEIEELGPEIVREIGDCYWYIAALCRELDIDLEFSSPFNEPPADASLATISWLMNSVEILRKASADLSGQLKKGIRDDGESFSDERKEKVKERLQAIMYHLSLIAHDLNGTPPEEIAEMNLDKLFDRKSRGKLKGDGDHR